MVVGVFGLGASGSAETRRRKKDFASRRYLFTYYHKKQVDRKYDNSISKTNSWQHRGQHISKTNSWQHREQHEEERQTKTRPLTHINLASFLWG